MTNLTIKRWVVPDYAVSKEEELIQAQGVAEELIKRRLERHLYEAFGVVQEQTNVRRVTVKCVSFQNKGLIDLRAIKTFGASAKCGSNPIGYFGTGLKYAIAVALRLGCTVELWRGLERYVFDTVDAQMRDKTFKIICMTRWQDDVPGPEVEELGFTTDLGRNWKAWQAFRELWCNTLDEDGEMQAIRLEPAEGLTTFHVSGQAMSDAWHERGEIILQGEPRWVSEGVEIHEKRGRNIYFRGIRVRELERPSALTYNIVGHSMELTEDRTLRYPHVADLFIREAILNSDDERLASIFLGVKRDYFEGCLDISDGAPGTVFERVLDRELTTHFRMDTNDSARRLWQRLRGKALSPKTCEPTKEEAAMLARAVAFCKELGLDVDRYPVYVSNGMEDHVLGLANMGEHSIYLNKRVFMQGTKMVAGTLMEELLHLGHRLDDETRAMQNYLVDLVVSMWEKVKGEPI